MANYANVNNFGDPRTPDWQQKNLTTVKLPNGQSWQVDRQAAPSFEGLLQELAKTGYTPQSSGGYNYRSIRGSDKLSQHAFGNAIDINAATNPRLLPGQAVVTDMPANIGDIAKKYNIEWGGNWKRPDAMHFEWTGPQGGQTTDVGAQAVPSLPNGAGTLPQAAGTPASSLSAMFTQPADASAVPTLEPVSPYAALAADSLANMFTQDQEQRRRQREDQAQADQTRRLALFNVPTKFG
jgi:hypothetical protein